MGFGGLPAAVVLHEIGAPWPSWVWLAFCCVLWPHLAYLRARSNPDPLRAELGNFVFDSALAGSLVPLMHFNVLPSAMLLTVVTADKINTGVRGLWLRSLPGMLLAILVGGFLMQFAFRPVTSMAVLCASLPLVIVHTLMVSVSSYALVRKVQKKNLQLEKLSQVDALTGLASRRHFESQATDLLARRKAGGADAVLMLVDVDRFKSINDNFGHSVGDDVLRGIAERLRVGTPAGAFTGRLGGDEFALAMPGTVEFAALVAESIRASVESFALASAPQLRCSISIGMARIPAAGSELRAWMESADRALYRAKHSGRNRTEDNEVWLETPQDSVYARRERRSNT